MDSREKGFYAGVQDLNQGKEEGNHGENMDGRQFAIAVKDLRLVYQQTC